MMTTKHELGNIKRADMEKDVPNRENNQEVDVITCKQDRIKKYRH